MPVLLVWLGQALVWLANNNFTKWVALRLLLISLFTVTLPWVLKDVLIWFWKVTSEYRHQILIFINNQISSVLGQANIDATLSLTSIAGYIANQIGLVHYFSILLSGFAICWALKFIGKFI